LVRGRVQGELTNVSRPIKVLHLITGLGVGGAETMLVKLLGGLDRQHFSSSVVSMTGTGAMGPRIADFGIPVHSLGLQRGLPRAGAVPRLVRLIRDFRPDVLQCWMYHADVLGFLAARIARVPKLVWNIRCSDLDFPTTSRSLRAVFAAHGLLSRFTDATVVNSMAGMEFHRSHGHLPKRWELIENGFDVTRFRADNALRAHGRNKLGLGENDIAIGMVARFDRYKDHATFIESAKILAKQQPSAIFILAGKGMTTENEVIAAHLRAANLVSRTRLLGEYEDTAQLLPCLDIATLCSYTEGFPNAVGEAMSCELPCVATDVGDSARLLGNTGRVVPPRDPQAVAQCWSELIALGAEGRGLLGLAARKRIQEQFSLESIVDAYARLYADLAQPRRGDA
jgi:glycosyltransferase involved in cell wall biosynthesis